MSERDEGKPWDAERKELAAIPGAHYRTPIGMMPGDPYHFHVEVPVEFGYALDWFWGTPAVVELREDGVFIRVDAEHSRERE